MRMSTGPLYVSARRDRVFLLARPVGIALHRSGGLSISGWPRRGGTTICWGRGLKETMRRHVRPMPGNELLNIGPIRVYRGIDF